MNRNVEIKAEVAGLAATEKRVAGVADEGPIIIEQEDTFFHCPHGRLKLRQFGGVKQLVSQSSGKMDHNYEISYRFSVNGRDYSGSLSRKTVYHVAALPAEGSSIPVRYLAAAPFLNVPADANRLMGIALGVLGIFLVIVSMRLHRRPAAEPVETQNAPGE